MRRRLLILVMTAVLPLVAVIGYNLVRLYQSLEAQTLTTTERDASRLASSVDRFVHQLAEESLAAGLAISENELPPERADAYLAALGSHLPVSDYVYLDPAGRVLASAAPGVNEGDDLSTDPAVREIREGADSAISDRRRNPDDRVGFAVFVAVERRGRPQGIAGVIIGADELALAMPERPREATVLVTDSTGAVLYSDDEDIPEDPEALRSVEMIAAALDGRTASGTSVRVPGVSGDQFGSHVPVGGTGWTAGYYLPRSSSFAGVSEEFTRNLAIVGIVVLLALLAARHYALSITRPLAQLTDAANQVGQGRFDAPVTVEGTDELGLLAEDFRRMQSSLAHTFDDVATLTESAGRINSSLEVGAVLEIAFRYLRQVLDAHAVVATLVAEQGRGFEVFADGVDADEAGRLAGVVGRAYPLRTLSGRDHMLVGLERAAPAQLGRAPGDARYLVVLPLSVRTRSVGRLDVYCTPRASYAEFVRSAIPLGVSLSRQLAIAIANARLFERQQMIADTLQDSLLSEPYRLAGLDVGVVYRPATVGARIGGDFFDFIPVGEHAMAVIVGDISGKGIDAARHTAIAKGAIRSFALEDPWPSSVLARASRVIAEQVSSDTFVTAIYVLVDAETGALHYANAGHPPPQVTSASGEVRTLLGHGPPLGVVAEWDGDEHEARLAEGERLFLYTDGLTEARYDHVLLGSEGVARAAVELVDTPLKDVPGLLVLRAAEHAHGRLLDDVAVVVIEKTRR